MQPRRWRVADVTTVSELIQRVLHGEEFNVILLGGSTCSQIDLVDIASLAAAVPQIPILVAADCDDPERAHVILLGGSTCSQIDLVDIASLAAAVSPKFRSSSPQTATTRSGRT
jgi:hypothetical protein